MPAPKIPQPAKSRRVQTILPEQQGDPVPQEPLKVDTSLVPIEASTPMVDRPKARFMDSAASDYFDLPRAQNALYRWSSLFALSLFARQFYYTATDSLDAVRKVYGDAQFTRYKNVGTHHVEWDEWKLGGRTLLVFGGNRSADTFLENAGNAQLTTMAGQPDTFRFWPPSIVTIDALETALWAQYAFSFLGTSSSFVFAGHDSGGSAASWLAYRVNKHAFEDAGHKIPVVACYTFGAPPLFTDESGDVNFRERDAHFRVVAPGDCVPGLPAQVLTLSGYGKTRPSSALNPFPRHYSSRDICTDGTDKVFRTQSVLAQDFWALFQYQKNEPLVNRTTPSGVTLSQYRTAHDPSNYAVELANRCRAEGDTPYPAFPNLVTWQGILGTTGLAPR